MPFNPHPSSNLMFSRMQVYVLHSLPIRRMAGGLTLWQVILKQMGHPLWSLLSHDVLEVLQQTARLPALRLHTDHTGVR